MRRAFILMAMALPALTACGGNDVDSKVTETRMDDIDSIEGTISDEMVSTDEMTEMAPVEATAAPTPAKTEAEDKAAAAEKDKPASTPAAAEAE